MLLAEVLQLLDPKPGFVVVDGTLGGGGHAREILERITPGGILVGIDMDAAALEAAGQRLQHFSKEFRPVKARYEELEGVLDNMGIDKVNGILLDLGVSSFQLDEPARGFSFRKEGPLDMRMDRSHGLTAASIIRTYRQEELSRIIREHGEERWASRIASFIVVMRERKPIETTTDLVEVIKDAIPASARRAGGHPARRTFQALRIEVNQELRGLRNALIAGTGRLASGGRMAAIAYHSLEDRIVKNTFRELKAQAEIEIITKSPITPGPSERRENPRSRGAKLRVAEKV